MSVFREINCVFLTRSLHDCSTSASRTLHSHPRVINVWRAWWYCRVFGAIPRSTLHGMPRLQAHVDRLQPEITLQRNRFQVNQPTWVILLLALNLRSWLLWLRVQSWFVYLVLLWFSMIMLSLRHSTHRAFDVHSAHAGGCIVPEDLLWLEF